MRIGRAGQSCAAAEVSIVAKQQSATIKRTTLIGISITHLVERI
jgi:hypothetical protein